MNLWAKVIFDQGFDSNRDFDFAELFGDVNRIRRWHFNSLPTDQMSINNAIIIEKTTRFCMLLDAQHQGLTWLKK